MMNEANGSSWKREKDVKHDLEKCVEEETSRALPWVATHQLRMNAAQKDSQEMVGKFGLNTIPSEATGNNAEKPFGGPLLPDLNIPLRDLNGSPVGINELVRRLKLLFPRRVLPVDSVLVQLFSFLLPALTLEEALHYAVESLFLQDEDNEQHVRQGGTSLQNQTPNPVSRDGEVRNNTLVEVPIHMEPPRVMPVYRTPMPWVKPTTIVEDATISSKEDQSLSLNDLAEAVEAAGRIVNPGTLTEEYLTESEFRSLSVEAALEKVHNIMEIIPPEKEPDTESRNSSGEVYDEPVGKGLYRSVSSFYPQNTHFALADRQLAAADASSVFTSTEAAVAYVLDVVPTLSSKSVAPILESISRSKRRSLEESVQLFLDEVFGTASAPALNIEEEEAKAACLQTPVQASEHENMQTRVVGAENMQNHVVTRSAGTTVVQELGATSRISKRKFSEAEKGKKLMYPEDEDESDAQKEPRVQQDASRGASCGLQTQRETLISGDGSDITFEISPINLSDSNWDRNQPNRILPVPQNSSGRIHQLPDFDKANADTQLPYNDLTRQSFYSEPQSTQSNIEFHPLPGSQNGSVPGFIPDWNFGTPSPACPSEWGHQPYNRF